MAGRKARGTCCDGDTACSSSREKFRACSYRPSTCACVRVHTSMPPLKTGPQPLTQLCTHAQAAAVAAANGTAEDGGGGGGGCTILELTCLHVGGVALHGDAELVEAAPPLPQARADGFEHGRKLWLLAFSGWRRRSQSNSLGSGTKSMVSVSGGILLNGQKQGVM